MSSRGRRSAVILVAAAVALALPTGLALLAPPAGAAETGFTDTCADVYGHRAMGNLDKTTDPVAGSAVASGQQVRVTLRWPTYAVAGERAHRIMECLSINGGAPQLWADQEFTTANDTVTFTEAVPSGLSPRTTVCGQSFLKTQGAFGPVTRWSDKTCYPVDGSASFHALSRSPSPPSAPPPAPESRSTPTTGPTAMAPPASPPGSPSYPPPGSGEWVPPWPPWEKTPRVSASPPVSTTPTTRPAGSAAPAPRKASGAQAAAPAPRSAPGAPSQTLPRTGAGVVVLLGVAAVALFSGRTLRRASDHIADSLPVPAVPVDEDDDPTLVLGRRW